MESSNSNGSSSKAAKRCHCGNLTTMRTSWTDSNPGRRFLGCSTFGKRGGCGFFEWHDPPMCARSVRIIPGLLRRINKLEEERNRMATKLKLWIGLAAMLCIVVIILLLVLRLVMAK